MIRKKKVIKYWCYPEDRLFSLKLLNRLFWCEKYKNGYRCFSMGFNKTNGIKIRGQYVGYYKKITVDPEEEFLI
jgi:hypothetical protein